MAKDIQFRAYDLQRKKTHSITSPPAKITRHRMSPTDWAKTEAAAPKPTGKITKKQATKTKQRAAKKKLPRTAIDILRCWSAEIECLHCGKLGDDPTCGPKCYQQFHKQHSIAQLIDIRGPSPLGYGAFTKPGVQVTKGQWLDEYIGELKPLDNSEESNSLYRCEIPGVCAVDAEEAGNWTRFINSHCRPNVRLWGEFVGKRHVILFQALRDIGPEEEVVFNYGRAYFEQAGFECGCDAQKRAHMPGGEAGGERAKKSSRR